MTYTAFPIVLLSRDSLPMLLYICESFRVTLHLFIYQSPTVSCRQLPTVLSAIHLTSILMPF